MTSQGPSPFLRKASGLVRTISSWDALVCNMMFMGFLFASLELTFGAGLYPGVNLPLSFFFVVPTSIVIAFTYALLTSAMPRTGGDYVFVGRIINPALGFMVNFYFTMVLMSWIGSVVPWGTQYGLATMFTTLGMLWKDQGLLALGTQLAGYTPLSFIISAALILACVSIIFVSAKAVVKAAWALFILMMGGVVAYMFAILSVSHDVLVTNFNAMSGTTVNTVLNAASASPGYPVGYTLMGTLLGSVYLFLGSIGYTGSAYYAGEVKGVVRSQIIAMVGAVLIFTAVAWPIYIATYSQFGGDFINALTHMAIIGDPSVSSLPAFPSLTFLTVFASQNPWIVAFVNFAFFLTCVGSCGIVVPFVTVRNIFAWAYDRVVPSKLAGLDKRGQPIYAVAVVIIAGEIWNYLYYFTGAFTYLSYSTLGWFIATAIVCLAAAAFPYRRRDIFDASPSLVKKKVGGLPILTILGAIGFVISAAVAAATITPAYAGTISYTYVVAIVLTLVAGPVIYYISYYYQKRRGIPVELAHSQLPPE